MHFMRENLLETVDVTVAPEDAGLVADRLKLSSYDFTAATQEITLTFATAVSFEKLWLKTEGIVSWTAVSGGDTTAFANGIESGEQSSFHSVEVSGQTVIVFEFTKASDAATARVFEIMLMPSIFDLDESQRPMRFFVRDTDPSAAAYRTENDTLASYAGQSEGKAIVFIGWDYMPKPFTNQLRQLWKGPPLRRPFIIYPEPDDNPDDIYEVYWHNDFERVPSARPLSAGYTVNAILWEI